MLIRAGAMPIEHWLDEGATLARVEVVGLVTIDDALRAVRSVAGALGSRHWGVIADLRAKQFVPTLSELRSVANEFGRFWAAYRGGVAFVVSNDVHYGLGRLLATLVEWRGIRMRVFRTSPAAERWLATGMTSRDVAG